MGIVLFWHITISLSIRNDADLEESILLQDLILIAHQVLKDAF